MSGVCHGGSRARVLPTGSRLHAAVGSWSRCVLRSAGPTVLGCGNNSIENSSTPQLRRLRRAGRCHRQQLTNRRAARSSLGGRPSASMPCVENGSAVASETRWGSVGPFGVLSKTCLISLWQTTKKRATQCNVAKQCPSPRRCCLSGSRQAPARPTLPPARCPAPAGRNKASTARRLSRPQAQSAGICRHNACEPGVPGAAAYPRCPTRTFRHRVLKRFERLYT